jgi:hypothetical protein
MQGYGCIVGSNPGYVFSAFTYSYKLSRGGTYGDCRKGPGNSSGATINQSGSGTITYLLDEYGNLYTEVMVAYGASENGYDNAYWDNVIQSGYGSYSLSRNGDVKCSFTNTENGVTTNDECNNEGCEGWGGLCITSLSPTAPPNWTTSCEESYISIDDQYSDPISCCYVCGEQACPGGEPPCECSPEVCDIIGVNSGSREEYGKIKMGAKKTSVDFLSLARQSAQTKLSIKLRNGRQSSSENSYCDEDGTNKDACWGSVSTFEVLPETNGAVSSNQLIKFRVALSKDLLLKRYKNINGKVHIYTSGGDPNISPCCNSCGCFDGNILLTQEFVLNSSGPLFTPYGDEEMIAVDLDGLYFNSKNYQNYVGTTLRICAVIDSFSEW